ncbi:MAG TPA: HAD family hydrolase [Thermodesulfobacteriota bacterium]|nr:HAD family hydrolase [Thermodesulfobacteriota bacterium]
MKGLLFDWDGTLINSEPWLLRIWQKTLEPLGRQLDEQTFRPLIGLVARDIARTLFPEDPSATTDFILRRRLEVYEEFYRHAAPYPDAADCLAGLHHLRYRMAVMTSNSASRIQTRLQQFRWGGYFQAVIGEGMVTEAKPSPQIVLAAARALGLLPEDCYVVGDAQWDVVAGNRAGATTILVCREEERLKELLPFDPRYYVRDLREILNLVPSSQETPSGPRGEGRGEWKRA